MRAPTHTTKLLTCLPLRHPEAKPKDLAVGKPGKTAPSGSRNKRFLLGKAPSTQAVAPLRMTIPRHPELQLRRILQQTLLFHPEAKPKDPAGGKPGITAPSGSGNERFLLGKAPSMQAVAPLSMTSIPSS